MKTIIIQITIALLLAISLPLQAQDLIEIKHSCSFDEEETNQEFYVFKASSEADRIVEQIVGAVSLAKNFVVKSADCKNALATKEGNQRYILYNTSFLEDFKKDAKTQWAAYCVLAHEIGHHLNNHDFESTDSKKRKKMELEADIFAGGVLYTLGATLEEAKAGIKQLQSQGESSTHPPARARAEAIANGWKNSQDFYRKRYPELVGNSNDTEDNSSRRTDNTQPTHQPEKPAQKNKTTPITRKEEEPAEKEDTNMTEVSDALIAANLLGTWQLGFYNNYGQLVTMQNMLYVDGSMSVQTFINGILTETVYYSWAVKNNIFTMVDANGYYYNYSSTFYGTNNVVMTFLATNGNTMGVPYGTQFSYNRVQ